VIGKNYQGGLIMRIISILVFFIFLVGCTGKETIKEPDNTVNDNKIIETVKPATGWTDRDTYTVSVIAEDIDKAKQAAKHKILQDIVKVRMINESRYTDITKISAEFDKPLKEGKILSQRNTAKGIEIFFQIKDSGLREKFEKK